ncbi:MAG: DNA polymerase III subunit delta [Lachnospiraceae bacterium]|nr:DNA polymerase III subunit delta [Lachnospiraceae bacterium]
MQDSIKKISENLKSGEFKRVYLLYGPEDYLKRYYGNELKKAMLSDTDDMNYSYFEGKNIDVTQVISMAETLPFFSEKRVVFIKNSGLFKSTSELEEYLPDMPETTCMIFVENEVDKRKKLFKVVKEIGVVAEVNNEDIAYLRKWIGALFVKNGKKVTQDTVNYLIEQVGCDMQLLANEAEKVICYAYEKEIVTAEDIDQVCCPQVVDQIFQMLDAVADQNQTKALRLYKDLITLRQRPASILYLLSRHFDKLLTLSDLQEKKVSSASYASKLKVPPFAVRKYAAQTRHFSKEFLRQALEACADTEEKIKSGRLADGVGVEMLLLQFSKK